MFSANEQYGGTDCPKGSKTIIISERISVGLPIVGSTISGSVQLTRGIDDVLGIRVRYIGVSSSSPITAANGTLLALRSATLGQNFSRNPFQIATSTDVADSIATAFTDVIGVYSCGLTNEERGFDMSEINKRINFSKPVPISKFDWALTAVNGSFNLGAAFAVEIIIDFYVKCYC